MRYFEYLERVTATVKTLQNIFREIVIFTILITDFKYKFSMLNNTLRQT